MEKNNDKKIRKNSTDLPTLFFILFYVFLFCFVYKVYKRTETIEYVKN